MQLGEESWVCYFCKKTTEKKVKNGDAYLRTTLCGQTAGSSAPPTASVWADGCCGFQTSCSRDSCALWKKNTQESRQLWNYSKRYLIWGFCLRMYCSSVKTHDFEDEKDLLFTTIERNQSSLPLFSPVTFNHDTGGNTGGRGGGRRGGRGGEEGDDESWGGEDRLALFLQRVQWWQWRLTGGGVVLVPAALQEHELMVVLPLRHKLVVRVARLTCFNHFVLTLKSRTEILELVFDVFHLGKKPI